MNNYIVEYFYIAECRSAAEFFVMQCNCKIQFNGLNFFTPSNGEILIYWLGNIFYKILFLSFNHKEMVDVDSP